MGQHIEFKSNGDQGTGYLAAPEAGHGPGVIILQEWWGMVPHIIDVADRFAAEGFTALVPDLYRGERSTEPDEAMKLMMAMNLERAARDMSGAVDLLTEMTGGPVGVVGFCMGGGLALVLGTQRPDAVKAVVPFYGLIPWPEVTPDYSQLAAAVQGHYATRDAFASPELVRSLDAELRSHDLDAEFYIYDDTDHAFFNDDRPEVFAPDAAATAWDRTIQFLRSVADGTREPATESTLPPDSTESTSDADASPTPTSASLGGDHPPVLGDDHQPIYRGGHADTSIASFPRHIDMPMLKTGWIPIGDDDDGPAISVVVLDADTPEGDPHSHASAEVRYIASGALKVGTRWYRQGDIRIQEAGMPYGPEIVGPDGCTQVLFFSDRRGLLPQYRDRFAERHAAATEFMTSLLRQTGIEPT